jgi:hypothetical protein
LNEVEGADAALIARVNAVDKTLRDIDDEINGDPVLKSRNEPAGPALTDRITNAVNGFTTTSAPTATHTESLALAEKQFVPLLARLRQTIEVELRAIDQELNNAGAPWTPGRIPAW